MFLQVCPVCEHRNPRGSRFCNECGSPLQLRFCPECHAAEDVMSLECRTCGARLPMLVLTDAAAVPDAPPVVTPPPESIWKTVAPQALPPEESLDADEAVTVHGEAGAPPAMAPLFHGDSSPASDAFAIEGSAEELASSNGSVTTAPARPARRRMRVARSKRPTVIELLHDAPTGLELQAVTSAATDASPASPLVDPMQAESEAAKALDVATALKKKNKEPPTLFDVVPESSIEPVGLNGAHAVEVVGLNGHAASEPVELNAESESEIEVSVEAETLVEASVAPVTYEQPAEIAFADAATTHFDDVATQLSESAWRRAMPADESENTHWTPALIAVPQPQVRRLSLHRVGLAVVALGAVAAAVYSANLSPGTSPAATRVATSPAEPVAPAVQHTTTEAAAVAPSTAVVLPAVTNAKVIQPGAATLEPPALTPVEEKPPKSERVAAAPSPSAPAPAAKPQAARPVPAPVPSVDLAARGTQARRVPTEVPRPCTAAVAALNLCTPESGKEGN